MQWLIDTNIFIDYSRNHAAAVQWLESHYADCAVSTLSVAEYEQGIRHEHERLMFERFCDAVPVLPVTRSIAVRGGAWALQYRKSHGSGLFDCLIAATALEHGLQMSTLNVKHFPMCKGLRPPY
ncbi:MAG: type II toxin-antitoxin system VapC family toxin [Pseudomonadota bacterium]|nr:type II toxin-antitoxin system VapC family toxin [Pseudomonadota bacterium]